MNITQALRRALELSGLPLPESNIGRMLLMGVESERCLSIKTTFAQEILRELTPVLAALRDAEARAEQPPPIPGGEPVWPMVLADLDAEEQRYREEEGDEIAPFLDQLRRDMIARDAAGREKYNMPLTTNNGHDAGRYAYKEALDLVVYARQRLAETPKDHLRYDRHLRAFLASLDRAVCECCLRYEVTS